MNSRPFRRRIGLLSTFGNVLTLLLTGPPSSLSATNTTSLSCLPKRVLLQYYSYLQPPTTPNVFDKQPTNSCTANPPHPFPPLLLALHLQTALLLFSLAEYPNCAFLSPATLSHHLRTHPPPVTPPTVYSILTSQPTANITPPKQLCCTCTITSSVQ